MVITVSDLLLRLLHSWPSVAPQPSGPDPSIDVLDEFSQARYGLRLSGYWSDTIGGFYSGPMYLWTSLLGGKTGQVVAGSYWYFFGAYILVIAVCSIAVLYGILAIYRSVGINSAAGALLGYLYLGVFAHDLTYRPIRTDLFSYFWGPSMTTPLLLASVLCCIGYCKSGKYLGGVMLLSGLTFQVYSPTQIPALSLAAVGAFGMVARMREEGVRPFLRSQWVVVLGSVIGWWPIAVRILTEGPGAFTGKSAWQPISSYWDTMVSAGYIFSGKFHWLISITPFVLMILAVLVWFIRPKFRREAFLVFAFNAAAVLVVVAKKQNDPELHSLMWYTVLIYIYIYIFAIWAGCVLVGVVVGKLLHFKPGFFFWGGE